MKVGGPTMRSRGRQLGKSCWRGRGRECEQRTRCGGFNYTMFESAGYPKSLEEEGGGNSQQKGGPVSRKKNSKGGVSAEKS